VFRKPLFVALAISLLALLVVWYDYSFLKGIAYTLPYFAGGVAMFVFTARFGTNPWLALLSALLLALSFVAGMQLYAFAVFGAYLVVFLGQHHNPASSFARRVGDWSYGIYLFGWPVEQLANQFFKTNNGFHLFLYSLPVVLAVGAISWVAVERPSLKLKRRVAPLFSRSRLSLKAAKLPETQFAKEYG
jgi:peptidoglycan/LPS O-acetylase OafA/YrhL